MKMSKPTIGFIILRHVNSETTNLYWQLSYDNVRQFYPENDIIIIDDNSNYQYVSNKAQSKPNFSNVIGILR